MFENINNKDLYNSLSVLFVDDDKGFINSLKRALINEKFTRLFAQSGMEALEILQNDKVNVMIADMKMPQMDGLSLLRKVKIEYPGVVRMILTAYTNPDEILESINSGEVFRYIVKPLKSTSDFKSYIYDAMDYFNLKTLEKKLRESEERYRVLFESSPDGIAITDIQSKKPVYVNSAFNRMLGYNAEELKKMKLIDLPPDEKKEYVRSELKSQHLGEKALAENLPLQRKDGTIRYVDINSTQITIGGKKYIIDFFRDITKRKKAENGLQKAHDELERRVKERTEELFNITEQLKLELTKRKQVELELRESSERYRTLVNKLGEGVGVADLEEKFIISNPAAEKIFGVESGKLNGRKLYEFLDSENSAKVKEETKKRKQGISSSYEFEIIRPNGEKRQIIMTATPKYDKNSKVIGSLGIFRDITEQKKAEEALRKSEEQLRQAQKMEAIGRLAGGMAHDFNNLLTAVLGYSELLLNKLDDLNPLTKYPREIKKAAELGVSLASQLLTFSRRQVVQLKGLDLSAVVIDMEKILHRLIGEDIELVTILNPKLGGIKADKTQIDQIIMNLSINARDAMPQGGKITLETNKIYLDEDYANRHIEVKPGNYVMLKVSDTGWGMDEETVSHIFEPFFTTKDQEMGTGLGLSTVYGIVKQSEGYIDVQSKLGHGTTFKIYFPSTNETIELPKLPKSSVASAKLQAGWETILLVEDEESVWDLVCEVLKENGYTVLAAHNGNEAISICKQHKERIDLMLTDMVMPQMSGVTLAEKLKPTHSEMKVLYMSGYTGDDVVSRGLLKTGTPFLKKPFSPETLLRKIRELLEETNQKLE